MAMNECKDIMLYEADTPCLVSRTQNICFLISISAFILKLMVKITSIFFSYRFLRIAWPDIFWPSDHFRTPNPRSYVFFLCHGRLVVGYVWCRRGSFGAAMNLWRWFRPLVYNYVCSVSITPQGSQSRYICYKISHLVALVLSKISGTQRLFSVKYLFGEANIA